MKGSGNGRTPMMDQYLALKSAHPDSILFYRMGDFYEMFYEDAKIASEVLGLRLTSRAHGKAAKVPLAGFPYHQLDTYLIKMVNSGRRVVVVDQVEDPKKAKGLVKRDIARIVTAGTNPAAIDSDEPSSTKIAASIKGRDSYGYAWADVSTGEFCSGEFDENEFTRIEQKVNPVEVVVPTGSYQGKESINNRNNTPVISKIDDWVWEYSFAKQTLLDHFRTSGLKGFGIDDLELAVSAAGALLYYLKGNLGTDPSHLTSLSRATTGGQLHIEPTTQRNLELVESLTGDNRATLFQVVDRTVTPAGRRTLFNRLLNPLADRKTIEERLETVAELTRKTELRASLRALLKDTGNIHRYLARLATGRSSARDLSGVVDTLRQMPSYIDFLKKVDTEILTSLREKVSLLPELLTQLESALVDDPPHSTTDGGIIRDGFDKQIDELRHIRDSGKSWISEYEQKERQQTGIPNLKVSYNRVFGYYIEITKTHQAKVPDRYIRRQTLVAAERYTTPELQQYEEKLLGAEEKVYQLEQEIYQRLVTTTLEKSSELQENARIIAELDFYASLAQLAVDEDYCRPVMEDSDRILLKNCCHPVVENMMPPGEKFVPNDLEIGGEGTRMLIIKGPNMAGKSTYLRQVAISVILAQMGSFVPARDAVIGVVDKLFTRIGALDNLAGGESTFMIEMQETASILNNATRKSLVLFDEVGRGTSTFDGLSLAWSIIEYLHEIPRLCPRTLFATHYHEMVELAGHLSHLANRNVSVREYGDKVVFLRKIVEGGCDRSFGIHVAQLAGLPPEVIERAKEVLANLEANDLSPGEPSQISVSQKPTPKKHLVQLSFFDSVESKLRDIVSRIDPNQISPLEALEILNELKRHCEES